MGMGIPELLVVASLGLFWLVPLAVAVWAVVTLYRMRTTQLDMQARIDAIERLLQQP